jgi:AcrR family transcriptional regulator
VGRPKEHDEATAAALLDASERILEAEGLDALSVRRVADEVGTTTRAVYSLFGSKEGLLGSLGAHAFDILGELVGAQRLTQDTAADLARAGLAFRRFALEHPALFRLAVLRVLTDTTTSRQFGAAAARAFAVLESRVQRVKDAGLLGDRDVYEVACEFHALCEGLASVELRGTLRPRHSFERVWKDALTALVTGLTYGERPTTQVGGRT